MENRQKDNEKPLAKVLLEGLVTGAVVGTWVMVMFADSKLNQLKDKVDSLSPKPITLNVMGGEAPERFYDLNGQRVYLEVDGKPVEQYFAK